MTLGSRAAGGGSCTAQVFLNPQTLNPKAESLHRQLQILNPIVVHIKSGRGFAFE